MRIHMTVPALRRAHVLPGRWYVIPVFLGALAYLMG